MPNKAVILFIFTLFFSLQVHAQALDSKIKDDIDNFVNNTMHSANIPSLALSIVKNKEVVYIKSYNIDSLNKQSITTKSPFIIGSLTKSFTALAIMQLKEEEKINLNTSVNKYIPWFKTKNIENSNLITVKQLLNHTSGFSTYDGLKNWDNWDESDLALEKQIKSLEHITLVSQPGETYEYSNINYQILGLLIQEISGQSYEQYIQKNIFNTLEMENSFFSPKHAINGHQLVFGQAVQKKFPFNRSMLPAGYLVSSVEDMSKYLISHLNNGNYNNKNILSKSGVQLLHTPSSTIIKDKIFYGLGWFIHQNEKRTTLKHTGATENFSSVMLLSSEKKLGVIVLMNTNSYTLGKLEIENISSGIARILNNKKPRIMGFDKESYFIYLIFFLLLVIQIFILSPLLLKAKKRSYSLMAFDLAVILSLSFVFPKLFNLTLQTFILFVPDIAYLMITSIIIAILSMFTRAFTIIKAIRTSK